MGKNGISVRSTKILCILSVTVCFI